MLFAIYVLTAALAYNPLLFPSLEQDKFTKARFLISQKFNLYVCACLQACIAKGRFISSSVAAFL